MKALIIFDSTYGNTEKIAQAMAKSFASSDKVKVIRPCDADTEGLESLDLLIVGSPTQGGRPTPALQEFFAKIPANALKNVSVASFDTRFEVKEQGLGLRVLMKTVGYAAGRIADSLKDKGARLVAEPEGFIVTGKEGPLKKGETERSTAWAAEIVKKIKH